MKLCKEKKVKIKDGRTMLIRRPKMSDVKELLGYVNSLIDEGAPIRLNKKVSLNQEREWIRDSIKALKNGSIHMLVSELDGKIVSASQLKKDIGRASHVAEIGISVHKDYRRLGIATAMFERMLWVGKRDKSIKVITLHVYEYNKKAQKLYRKMGFKKVARLENRVNYDGKLGDTLVMDYKG